MFSSPRGGALNIYAQAADGTGTVEQLTDTAGDKLPYALTSDGTRLVFRQANPETGGDLHVLALDGERRQEPLLHTPFNEANADISPDGRWVAYQSNESGRDEVYVRPFPNVETGRWQVSTGGGSRPLWARNGRELFYLAPDGRLMAVPVEPGAGGFASGSPVRVLDRAYANPAPGRSYDVSPDGRRFLFIKEGVGGGDGATLTQFVVVLNWFEELKRLAPGGG